MSPEPQNDSQEPKAPKKCNIAVLQDLSQDEREAILDDVQANWSRLPAPPSAAEVNLWIKASRRGE